MTTPRDIIVIGASVGGLDAVSRLAAGLTSNLKASLFVVIHTAPNGPMLAAELIGRRTTLHVGYGAHGQPIEDGHVYMAPPDYHMTLVAPGSIRLAQGPRELYHRPAANPLFRSAARAFGSRVIGIVMTGGDGDGADGMIAVNKAGGIGIVQEPVEAQDPSMPRTALAEDHPAYRIPIDKWRTYCCNSSMASIFVYQGRQQGGRCKALARGDEALTVSHPLSTVSARDEWTRCSQHFSHRLRSI